MDAVSVSNPSLLRAERLVAGRGSFRTAPLDLDVRPGDVVAIVGPSVSGQTSILRPLASGAPPGAARNPRTWSAIGNWLFTHRES